MNVVFTIDSLAPDRGGPSRTVPALCTALAAEGIHVELLARHAVGVLNAPGGLAAGRFGVHVRPAFLPGRLHRLDAVSFRSALGRLVSENRVDLLHDNGAWLPSNHAAAAVARWRHLPLVLSIRGMLEPWSMGQKPWKKRLAWRLYQRRDVATVRVLHATSVMEAENARTLGFRQPIAVIPNGVELPALERRADDGDGVRTALFLSRIHPKKGLLHLVEAWATVRPAGWRVLVVGPDEVGHRAEVEAAAAQQGVAADFLFAGPVDDRAKWDVYRQADLFVLPTLSENFGIVVTEAMACGVPVLTTRAAPWQDLATHRCGWWVEVGAAPLARALDEATRLSEAERRAMGRRGRALVEQQYTWPRIAREMLTVYAWVLGRAPKPSCVRTG